jgi:UDP-GlcNAc:undecaprenyl-phosphate/decaprenyl-phosphate GlcNAc-1-phosphate transferase
MYLILIVFALAMIASLALTAMVRHLARRWNFVDRPDGKRKIQREPVALGGGIAIFGACCVTMAFIVVTRSSWDWVQIQAGFMLAKSIAPPLNFFQIGLLMAASAILCLVGLYDDRYHLRGRTKLLWQILACAIIVYTPGINALYFRSINFLGEPISLGQIGPLLTMAWFIVSINSFNLIDGVDGLAGTLGVLFSATFGIMALMMGNLVDGVVAFTLVGSILGFLRYNSNPASIYMGDAGSMFIGLVLGWLAVRSSLKGQAISLYAAPLAVWTIPLLDTLMAILRRKLTGRSIYATDRGHIHHRMLTHGLTPRQTVGLIGGLCLITSLGAVLSLYFQREWLGWAGIFIVFGLLVGSRLFGHVELLLLNSKMMGFGRALVKWGGNRRVMQTSQQLQGKLQWEEKVWIALIESAERFGITQLKLNLYLPQLHEDFHASWKAQHHDNSQQQWRLQLPLTTSEMIIGSLDVVGTQNPNRSASAQLTEFLDFLEPLESQLASLLALPATPAPVIRAVQVSAPVQIMTGIGSLSLSSVNKSG